MRWLAYLAVAGSASAIACSQRAAPATDGGPALPATGGVAQAQYCALRAEIACRLVDDCCGRAPAVDLQICERVERVDCEDEIDRQLAGPWLDGPRVFDTDAAGECLRSLSSQTGCAAQLRTSGERQRRIACDRLWKPPGTECVDRICAWQPRLRVRCTQPVHVGGSFCESQAASGAGGSCRSDQDCENGLSCGLPDQKCDHPQLGPAILDQGRCDWMRRVDDAFEYRGTWQVLGLAADDRHLFWIETSRSRRRIVRAPKQGGTPVVIHSLGPDSESDSIAESGSELYVRSQRRQLARIDKQTGAVRFAELPDLTELAGTAITLVVTSPDAAWFPDAGCRRVWQWPHGEAGARAITVSADMSPSDTARIGLAIEPSAAYCGTGGRIFRIARADESVTAVITSLKDVGPMLVQGDQLFFVNDRLVAYGSGALPWVDERLMSWPLAGDQPPTDLGATGGLVRRLVAGPGQLCWATDPLGTGTTRVACRKLSTSDVAEVDTAVTNGHIAADQQWLFWSAGESIRRRPLP